MIAAVITGHGKFGSCMLESAEMIIGKQENIQTIDFLIDQSVNDMDSNIDRKFSELDRDSGVIVLTDLMGGTPFNRIMLKASTDPTIKVIAGVNMPLIIEILNGRRNSANIDHLIKDIIEGSKESIVFGNELLAN